MEDNEYFNLRKNDIAKLKEIGLDKLISDFGDVIGNNIGGDEDSIKVARMYMIDFLNEVSRMVDPQNHTHIDAE